jgi:hypothetical protein
MLLYENEKRFIYPTTRFLIHYLILKSKFGYVNDIDFAKSVSMQIPEGLNVSLINIMEEIMFYRWLKER